jgi:hypothetical protein
MSRHSHERPQSATYTKPISSKTQAQASKNVERVDSILRRLRDTTFPREPYLVSVPSNVPYNHSRRYIPTWHNETPFTKDEEQLQYLSFIPPTNEDTLLSVVGGWSDEKGSFLVEEEDEDLSPRSKPVTARHSPAPETQRKKISLGQYKTKVKGDVEMTTETPPRRDMEKQAKKVNGIKIEVMPDLTEIMIKSPMSPEANGKKRAREDDTESVPKVREEDIAQQLKSEKKDLISPRPAKKVKLETTTSSSHQQPPPKAEVPHAPPVKAEAVPGLLSPTLPPKAAVEPVLPPLLSPTIPPSIQDFLDTELLKLDKAIDRHRTDTVKSLLATAGMSESGAGKSPGLLPTNGANRIRSDSAHSARSNHSALNGLNRIAALAQSPSRGSTPTRNGASPGPRQRHTICLKYGKRNRKRVEGLLKLASRPKKIRPDPTAAPAPAPEPIKRKLETIREAMPSKDRPKESSSDGVAKHQKSRPAALSVSDKPSTPVPAVLNSPLTIDHHVQARSTFSTPKKDVKSTAMQRVVSSDGNNDAKTPQTDLLSTPQPSTNKLSPSAPTSAPSMSSNSRDEWTALAKKYFDLGRKIKTEGTSCNTDSSPADHSLSLVLIIEGLLCFMINTFAVSAASSRQSNDPGWRGIIPYLDFVLRHARKTPPLHGLAMQLGALCRQHLHRYDMERLAKEPLPDDQSASAPTPGSDGNTKTSEDAERTKQKYIEFRDQLISNTRRCQAAWLEGSRLLSIEVLREEFPATWKRRATDFTLRGTERPVPRELGGSFFLPLDGNANPLEGVRYGVEVLQEWCEKGKVDWRCRIEL